MIAYRPDLDGLRALAIVPVVLFHAGFELASGGYVGVDVFFVISGFLITSVLKSAVERGHYSIVSFYERRIQRLLPALTAVLLTTFAAGLVLLAPADMLALSKSALAAVAFASNIFFFRQAGYFDTANELKPLLHTWSLAVEEQFYILYPILLALLLRFARAHLRTIMIGLLIGSLGLSVWASANAPTFNFYFAVTRAWELLAGAVLAFEIAPGATPKAREFLALGGVVLLLVPVVAYDAHTPFPGITAIPPVVGTALLIQYVPGTVVGRVLSLRPFVYTGLISYALYLWHWPIIVFARYATLDLDFRPLGVGHKLAALALATLLSSLSYHLVEQPLRRRNRYTRRSIFACAAVTATLLLAVSVTGLITNGQMLRVVDDSSLVEQLSAESRAFQRDECLVRDSQPRPEACTHGSEPATIALWGDSQAAHLRPAIENITEQTGRSFVQLTKAGCAPILAAGFEPFSRMRSDCPEFNERVFEILSNNEQIDTLVIAAHWQSYANGEILARGTRDTDLESSLEIIGESLTSLADLVVSRGGKLVVVGPQPTPALDLRVCIRTAQHNDRALDSCMSYDSARIRHDAARVRERILDPLLARVPFTFVDCVDVFCPAECLAFDDHQRPLVLDNFHLSRAGNELLVARLRSAIE